MNDARELMRALLADAGELYRAVFTLEFYEGLTGREIAVAVNRPEWFVDEIRAHHQRLFEHTLKTLNELHNEETKNNAN